MNKKTVGKVLLIAAGILLVGIAFYITLPPISIFSMDFWRFLLFIDIVVFVEYLLLKKTDGERVIDGGIHITFENGRIVKQNGKSLKKFKFLKWQIILTAAAVLFVIIGSVVGSTLFRAKTYSSLITVEEQPFEEGVAPTEYVSDIALMDTASAQIIGARTLGTLSDLVSQYNVSSDYTQIAMRDKADSVSKPYKVAPLEHASFFKWLKNRRAGIPGYVKVDTVGFDAEFVRLTECNIRYSPSAYFSDNLYRALRFRFPTAIFGKISFEVDDSGHPFWVASVMKPRAGLFGAMDVDYVVTLDACTGECASYAPGDSPDWIDIVYYGDLICQKFDWYGMLREGYFNSAFGQTNCVVTTEDFGYKIIGNDVYIFTGVTSTSNDEANIGFILSNARNGEYKFFRVAGAEEFSAMSAAEGSVQQYRYKASFPSLIYVDGEATYIMVLKDASGIVKMYSMVNVRNYNIVVTGETQEDVFRRYRTAIGVGQNNTVTPETEQTENVTVREIVYIVQSGETVVYLKTDSGVFRVPFDESLLFVENGDEVTVRYSEKSEGVTEATVSSEE